MIRKRAAPRGRKRAGPIYTLIQVASYLGLMVVLAGCVQVSNVVPTGKQTYYVSVVGNIGYNPTPRAIAKANSYCASRGQVATVTALQHTEWPRITTSVQFACTDKKNQKGAGDLLP